MLKRVLFILALLVVALATGLVYTVLHEGGHALMALAYGAKITSFVVNFFGASPHVSYSGALTAWQEGLVSLAGPLLPWLISLLVIPVIKKIKDPLSQFGLILYSVSCLASLVPSVILPIVYAITGGGLGEDVVSFIIRCKVNPYLTAAFFALLVTVSAWYIWKVGRIYSVLKERLSQIKNNEEPLPIKKPLLVVLAGFIILIVAFPQGEGVKLVGQYQNYGEFDFTEITESPQIIFAFELIEEKTFDLAYNIRSKKDVTLELVSLDDTPFLFEEGNIAKIYSGRGMAHPGAFSGFLLEEGCYGLQITTVANKGSLKLWFNLSEPNDADLEFKELLRLVQTGAFQKDSYKEDGYKLVSKVSFSGQTNNIVYEVPPNSTGFWVSAFLVGSASDFSLTYVEGRVSQQILSGYKATMGRAIFPKGNGGKLKFIGENGDGKLFLYVKMAD